MSKTPYTKPATTYHDQVAILRSRGMIIDDEDLALRSLQHYNYYRLGAYWLPFEDDHATHKFKPNTRFEEIIRLYDFDRKLRLLLMDAIERIEVSVRGQWAYAMGHYHGPHAHLDKTLAKSEYHWTKNKKALTKEVDRADEIFITHFINNYTDDLPPIWAVCEVMSLGLLSRWYKNLNPSAARSAIARPYKIDESVLESWLHHLSVVRNICAHHARLWNRNFGRLLPKQTQNKPASLQGVFAQTHQLYNTLILMLHMMDAVVPSCTWRTRLKELLLDHEDCLSAMGFPTNWQDYLIWIEK